MTAILLAIACAACAARAWWLGHVEEPEFAEFDWERGGSVTTWSLTALGLAALFLAAGTFYLTRDVDPARDAFWRVVEWVDETDLCR